MFFIFMCDVNPVVYVSSLVVVMIHIWCSMVLVIYYQANRRTGENIRE